MAQGQKTLKQLRAEALGQPVQRDEEGTKSIARVAADEGLPATPTSPLGAQTTLPGATPDQAKMAGTPAAMKNALGGIGQPVVAAPSAAAPAGAAPGTPPPETLSSRLRQKGVEATAPKQAAQDIENHYRIQEAKATAGSFGEAAERLIQASVPAAPAAPVYSVDAAAAQAAGLHTEDPRVAKALDDFAKSSQDAAAINTLESTVAAAQPGYDAHGIATKGVIKGNTAAQAVTQATPDKIALTDDTLQRLGVTPERAAKLFPPGTDLSTKTVADIQTAASAMAHRAESEMAGLRAAIMDPAAGRHERNAAAQELLARGGFVEATEADAQALEDVVDEGMTIELGGKNYSVADLLDDEQMSGVIDRLLREPADSPFRAEMEKKLPALVKFATTHAAALAEATGALQATQKKVVDMQQTAQQTWKKLNANGMNPETLELLLGKSAISHLSDPYSITSPDTSKLPVVAQALLDPNTDFGGPPDGGQQNFINRLSTLPASLAKELATLTPAELKATGFVTGGDEWKRFNKVRNSNLALNDTSKPVEERLAAAFGGDFSFAKAQTWLDSAKALADVSGDNSTLKDLQSVFDANHDGVLDTEAQLIRQTQATLGTKNGSGIKSFLAGQGKGSEAWEKFANIGDVSASQKFASDVVQRKKPAAQVEALNWALGSLADDATRGLSWDMLGSNDKKGMWSHLDDQGKQTLTRLLDQNASFRGVDDLLKAKDPTGAALSSLIPLAVFDDDVQASRGQTPVDYLEYAKTMAPADLEKIKTALATLNATQPPQASTKDYSWRPWQDTTRRLGEMVAAWDAVHNGGLTPAGALPGVESPTIGARISDPMGLGKLLPGGPVKDLTTATQKLNTDVLDAAGNKVSNFKGLQSEGGGGQSKTLKKLFRK